MLFRSVHLGAHADGLLDLLHLESGDGAIIDDNGGKRTARVDGAQLSEQRFPLGARKEVGVDDLMGYPKIIEHFFYCLAIGAGSETVESNGCTCHGAPRLIMTSNK